MLRTGHAFALALSVATSSVVARATPIPPLERTPAGKLVLAHPTISQMLALPAASKLKPLSAPPYGATRVTETSVDVTLDPVTGVTTAKLELTLEALSGTVTSLYLYVDEGLSISSATAGGAPLSYTEQLYSPLRIYLLTFSPGVVAGQTLTLSIDYGGTLKCSGGNGFGNSYCALPEPMGLLMEGSALPVIVDQGGQGGYNVWGADRALTFHLPSGTEIVASGDKVLDEDDGTTHTTRWETPGYHTAGPHMAVFGGLSGLAAAGTTPPTTVHALAAGAQSQQKMASWMPDILSFIDEQAGQKLPFPALDIVHLPPDWNLPGTASHGLVLLSENYGDFDLAYFEETLAHETAHEWWGILINPTDGMNSRWLTEGLATLSQIDYAARHFSGGLPTDEYLARRYNEHAQILRYMADPNLPPLVKIGDSPVLDDQIQTTIWAYLRSSATLDHLRVLVGPDAFAASLRTWVANCSQSFCDTTDFRQILEQESGLDLAEVFQHWVYEAAYPAPVLSFQQAPGAGEVEVVADGLTHDVPLRLILGYDDGSEEERLVTLSPSAPIALAVDKRVRFVKPNPRHDAVIWSRSAQSGDVTFDLEVDGLDVIRCAHSAGRTAGPQASGGAGIWRHDLDFQPACDGNGDGSVGDADLAAQLDAFATLRPEASR